MAELVVLGVAEEVADASYLAVAVEHPADLLQRSYTFPYAVGFDVLVRDNNPVLANVPYDVEVLSFVLCPCDAPSAPAAEIHFPFRTYRALAVRCPRQPAIYSSHKRWVAVVGVVLASAVKDCRSSEEVSRHPPDSMDYLLARTQPGPSFADSNPFDRMEETADMEAYLPGLRGFGYDGCTSVDSCPDRPLPSPGSDRACPSSYRNW